MYRFQQLFAGRVALFLSLFALIIGAKLDLIQRFGSDLPYWDQWDAEGDFLFAPYVEGRLTARDVFHPHNEHRPVFTRLLAVGLLELGDRHWDARVQMVVNAFLHAVVALVLLALAWRALPPLAAAGFAGIAALFFAMPVSWENTLAGFQSQFYFVLLFSALHIGGTLLARPRSPAWWLATLAGVAALLSMASGLLSALAIIAALGLRAVRDRAITRDDALTIAVNLVIAVAGWRLKGHVPDHDVLKAASIGAWLDSFLHQFSWPVTSLWAAPIGLAAPLAILITYWRRRIDGTIALTLVGACAWVGLTAAAISYARGADVHGYSSRYADTLAAGVLVHVLSLVYLTTTATTSRARRGWFGVTGVFVACALGGLSRESALSYRDTLHGMPAINEARIATVRRYVASKDPAFFTKEPWSELPYPDANRLAAMIDNPSIRALLPSSVRPPLSIAVDDATHNFSAHEPARANDAPLGLRAWLSAPDTDARFVSAPFAIETGRISLFAARDGDGATELRLIDEHGRAHAPLGTVANAASWKRVNFVVAPGSYRIEATHTGPGWLAFTQPIADTALSAMARKFVRGGPWFLGAGAVLGLIGIGLALARRSSRSAGGLPSSGGGAKRDEKAEHGQADRATRADRSAARNGASAAIALGLGAAIAVVLAARLGLHEPIARSGAGIPAHARDVPEFAVSAPTETLAQDDRFIGAAFLLEGTERRWFGTYVEGDAFTGTVASTPFSLTGNALYVPIAGYPNSPHNALALEILDAAGAPATTVRFTGENAREWPGVWRVDVTRWHGATARLVLADRDTAPRGWLAIGVPRISAAGGPAWLDAVPRNYAWYAIAAVAFGGLLFLPGLALATWHPQRWNRGAAWIALPGFALLGVFGLLVWVAGPDAMNLPANLWLGAHVAIAVGFARRWWRDGGVLARDEAHALGVYACVSVAALAFGALPLAVGHEFDRASTSQSRLIASPPDHAIPYRTAIYFWHGKNGREDRAIYYGNEWSAASRGPLAPLVVAAAFSLFDARPNDPPGNTLESWPAARDAFYLARIAGILTNALVLLGAAALATRLAPDARRLTLAWLAASPLIAIHTDFLWPKLLATFFMLLAVSTILERRRIARAAVFATLAYLSHPVGGLFVPPLILFLATLEGNDARGARREKLRAAIAAAGKFALVLVACVAPWLAFKAWVAHPDAFLRYPLGDGRGFLIAENVATWLRCRIDNLWLTLTPGGFFFSGHGRGWLEGAVSEPLRWALGYAKALPGALGLMAFFAAAFALFRRGLPPTLRAYRLHLLFGAFALLLAFWGFSNDGLGRNCLEPLPVLLVVFAAAVLPATWRGWPWLVLITALETLSVRAIGVVFAPTFHAVELSTESAALAALAAVAVLLPVADFFRRGDPTPQRSRR